MSMPAQVQLRPASSAAHDAVRASALRLLENDGLEYTAGPVPFDGDAFLAAQVASMRIRSHSSYTPPEYCMLSLTKHVLPIDGCSACSSHMKPLHGCSEPSLKTGTALCSDVNEAASSGGVPVLGRRLYIWQMEPNIQCVLRPCFTSPRSSVVDIIQVASSELLRSAHAPLSDANMSRSTQPQLDHAVWTMQPACRRVYTLCKDGAADDDGEGEDAVPSFREWELPSAAFDQVRADFTVPSPPHSRPVTDAMSNADLADKAVSQPLSSILRS